MLNGIGLPLGPLKKDKFEYLSHIEFADGIDLLGIDPEAELTFDACDPVPLISYHKLIAGETYYLQITADDPNDGGRIQVRVSDQGGSSPGDIEDVPCTSPTATYGTTAISSGAGSGATINLDFGCAFDGGNDHAETGSPHTGTDPNDYHAYDYDHGAANNGTMNESVWFNFVAPNSGRIVFESDYQSAIFSEDIAFFAPDAQFAPGQPTDLFCSNLTNVSAQEGALNGIFGGGVESAIITERCLEPGYTYYGMVDPANGLTFLNSQDIDVWLYDPSVDDPAANPPGNDILCLALANPLYEIPVQPFDTILPFQAVAGDNEYACIETLAGEPPTDASAANRADQTVWHYFVAPASGVVDIRLRAYIGLNTLNYQIFELLNGTDCYGGLNPATFTEDGTQATPQVAPLLSGSTDFNGTTVGLCCLIPGNVYAVQLDGGAPGDEGQYIIEYIEEIEVYAGDAQYNNVYGDTTTFNSGDTTLICYNDTMFTSVMVDALGDLTTRIPSCMDTGYVVHSTIPIPDTLVGSGFTYLDSTRYPSPWFINNGGGSGAFGDPAFNQVYYVSPLADETATWGDLTCPSASAENGAPFVFLQPITTTQTYDPNTCVMTFSASGGRPAYTGGLFTYVVTNSLGDTISVGTAGNGVVVSLAIPAADVYTITMTDGSSCSVVITINAMPCLDPCINNPVFITPDPIDSTVYTCLPGDSAQVTILLNGGDPTVNGTPYTVTVSGSSGFNANGTFSVPFAGNPTPFTFIVRDGDSWQVNVRDDNFCLDSAMHTFTYDLTNCPDFCNINPLVADFDYDCQPNGLGIINVMLSGGLPGQNGSNYYVTTSGSTVFGQTFSNAQIPGIINDTVGFSMIVNDGDTWQIIVMDDNMCADTISDTYIFGLTDCPDLCDLVPVVITPDPIDSTVYDCHPGGTATVTVSVTGGDPVLSGTNYTVTVSGSSLPGEDGTYTSGIGSFSFDVDDGDNWQVIFTDANGCADTASGQFLYNLTNCDDVCNLVPLVVDQPVLDCYPNGTADVTVTIAGGAPELDGSNYFVTVTGSTAGGNISSDPVAGQVGGSITYTFTVGDGDVWTINVSDSYNCQGSLVGSFDWNATNCPDICTDAAYNPITLNGGSGFTYDCDGLGNAMMTFTVTGGIPEMTGGAENYTALVTINGSTTTQIVSSNGSMGTFIVNLNNSATWSVQVFDVFACDTASILDEVFTAVNAVAETDATDPLLIGQIATIDASQSTGNNLSYSWTPMSGNIDGTTDFTAVTTTVQPVETTFYTVEVTDNLGCSDIDSVEVPVGRCIPQHAGFTPNDDGTNDLWQIPCLDLLDGDVEVYNRWGQLVYRKENYDGTWDGTLRGNGQPLPDATYYYVISVTYPSLAQPVVHKGTVTILR